MSEELKPCPFCRVVPKLDIDSDDGGFECGGSWSFASISARHKKSCPLYQSQECGEHSGSIQIVDFTKEELDDFIKAWNTRAPSEKPKSVDVQEALDYIDQYRVSFFVPATVKHYHTIKAALEQLGGE